MVNEELGPCGLPSGYGRRRPSGVPRRYENGARGRRYAGRRYAGRFKGNVAGYPVDLNAEVELGQEVQYPTKDLKLKPEDVVKSAKLDVQKGVKVKYN